MYSTKKILNNPPIVKHPLWTQNTGDVEIQSPPNDGRKQISGCNLFHEWESYLKQPGSECKNKQKRLQRQSTNTII